MARKQLGIFLLLIVLVVGSIALYLNLERIWKYFYPLKYKELVFKAAEEYEHDPYLLTAIMFKESRFNSEALSPKGAMGLMQIMPDTAFWIAEKLEMENFQEEDLYKPEVNIRFASWYLDNLAQEFDDNIVLILAAYNGGRGNVQRWMKENSWQGKEEEIEAIPFQETRNFVRDVLNIYKRYIQLYNK